MNIEQAMRGLSSARPMFHSEADFQFALSRAISAIHPDALIELEVPIFGVGEIDIIVHLDGQLYAIELKYKKALLSTEHNGRAYSLKKDGAADIGRCLFIKDITRLESFKGAIGFAILLSNEPAYWKGSRASGVSNNFDVSEGRIIPAGISLDWRAGASDGTRKGNGAPFVMMKEHSISWSNYSTIAGSEFRYAIVKTEGGDV